ncbi:MAG TPA: hypothetical protein VK543_10620 [Puia sp.]|nr:hypothetical protein [Puia sp.]
MIASRVCFLLTLCFICKGLSGQSTTETTVLEQQLEGLSEKQDAVTEDDQHWQELDGFLRHRIDLNHAAGDDLQALGMLSDLQIKNFIGYRSLLGGLLSKYELQAVPTWDLETIRRLLPYVSVGEESGPLPGLGQRWKGGDHSLLLRESQVLEKSQGFRKPVDSTASWYAGSPQRIFFRYGYNNRNLLQYGILGDKDAGEQFFRGAEPNGFDFYSFYFFAKRIGIIKSLALGDFRVNMGQGLIQWQGQAFSKSADVLAVKRQSAILRPYHSAGEFDFHRGMGISLQLKKWEGTAFISFRNISSNLEPDTSTRDEAASSFAPSGYHRTASELADKNNMRQFVLGGNLGFSSGGFHFGLNSVCYRFSKPVRKQNRPYNLYAIRGSYWSNASADYSYTYHNLHLFGEAAVDKNLRTAFVQGTMISLGQSMDAAILYRYIDPRYQALYANAFTESSSPSNENGLYAGLSVRPTPAWQLDLFFDSYQFPWLKYRADGPGHGQDFFVQVFYKPAKTWNVCTRFKYAAKTINASGTLLPAHELRLVPVQDWRLDFTAAISRTLRVRSRAEALWFDQHAEHAEQGWLGLVDLYYHPVSMPFQINGRIQYFETGGYSSRIYAFERDVLYSYSLPAFYDRGCTYYINIHAKLNRLLHLWKTRKPECEIWLRWSQTVFQGKNAIGTGLDEIAGNKRSEIKCQMVTNW